MIVRDVSLLGSGGKAHVRPQDRSESIFCHSDASCTKSAPNCALFPVWRFVRVLPCPTELASSCQGGLVVGVINDHV